MFVFVQKGKDILVVGFEIWNPPFYDATFRPGGLAETAAIKSGVTISTLTTHFGQNLRRRPRSKSEQAWEKVKVWMLVQVVGQ